MAGGLLLAVASCSLRDALPGPTALAPALRNEPRQEPTQAARFEATVDGITYAITPLADYEIWGLVVSRHDADTWWDWIHKAWKDELNVVDLCLVFAENAASGGYVGIDFSSGQFVCYAGATSDDKWRRFSMRALSNNHLLSDRASIVATLRNVRVGDQVRLRGWLSEYEHHHGFDFKRGTSLTRDDTGNGACETIYVQEVEVLRVGGAPWRWLFWMSFGLIVAGTVVWARAPLKVD